MAVRYFTTSIPGDLNHRNKHAVVDEDESLEFFAFPYQPYSARLGNYAATIGNYHKRIDGEYTEVWSANTRRSHPDGTSAPLKSHHSADKDSVFEWAYNELIENNKKGDMS
jgi:hypothetical protein